jgi:hypothetical protein
MGDTHVYFADQSVVKATFGQGGMVDILKPQTLVWHDVLDGYSVNPHHHGNPFVSVAKMSSGFGNIRKEVEETIAFVDKMTGPRKSVIVDSNHDDFLSRWISGTDWRHNPANAAFYLETALRMVENTSMGPGGSVTPDPFHLWVEKLSKNNGVRCLAPDESLLIGGIECGMHGDRGPNGSRGSIKNLARLGARTVIGHAHSPGIFEGCYQVGTSTPLRLEYTHGPSSWLNSHVVIYASGKRSLLTVIDGEWKL